MIRRYALSRNDACDGRSVFDSKEEDDCLGGLQRSRIRNDVFEPPINVPDDVFRVYYVSYSEACRFQPSVIP